MPADKSSGEEDRRSKAEAAQPEPPCISYVGPGETPTVLTLLLFPRRSATVMLTPSPMPYAGGSDIPEPSRTTVNRGFMALSRRGFVACSRLGLAEPAFDQDMPPLAMVMNAAEASVSVIDMNPRQVIKTVPTLREPGHWARSPDRRKLSVADACGTSFFILAPVTGDDDAIDAGVRRTAFF